MIPIMYDALIEIFRMRRNSRVEIEQGVFLFHQDDAVNSIYIVEQGCVEFTRFQKNGNSIVLQRADNKTVLAEASLYSNTYHCDALATLPNVLYRLPKLVFQKLLESDKVLSNRWAAFLAQEVQSSRLRLEILSRNTDADKLDGWLTWNDGILPVKGTWKNVASQIGVSPEALYRELAKRN